jgi:hypothetical protein
LDLIKGYSMTQTRYDLPTPTKTKVQVVVSTKVAPTTIPPVQHTGLLPQTQPAFDETFDQTQILNLEPQICDFGKFANGSCSKNLYHHHVIENLYVVDGYVIDGYFGHS